MPPNELVGFSKFWADYGTVAAFLMFFSAVGLVWFAFKVRTLIIQTETATELIAKLYQAHIDTRGEPLKMYDHHIKMQEMLNDIKVLMEAYQDNADIHYGDVKRLAGEEKWHNCPIDKCPNFPKILIAYQELIAKFEIFQVHAVESRDRANESLDRMADELFRLGQEVIAALRLQREAYHDSSSVKIL